MSIWYSLILNRPWKTLKGVLSVVEHGGFVARAGQNESAQENGKAEANLNFIS